MSTCVVMQPTYLPWSGYFNLMAQADVFVLLDDVQYNRTSWQTRNRILVQGAEQLLTVPVLAGHLDTRIQDVRLASGPWSRKHLASLTAAYAKAPHGPALLALLAPLYQAAGDLTHLVDWNHLLIRTLATALGLHTPLVRASSLGCGGHRSAHVLELCVALGCDDYLSPVGSADYLAEDHFATNGRVALRFQAYQPAPYAQRKAPTFVSHLSVVDVIAHLGLEQAQHYVRTSAS